MVNVTPIELKVDRDVINLLSDARDEVLERVSPKSILEGDDEPLEDSIRWLDTSRIKIVKSRQLEDYEYPEQAIAEAMKQLPQVD